VNVHLEQGLAPDALERFIVTLCSPDSFGLFRDERAGLENE
jgi:hypothetical protein